MSFSIISRVLGTTICFVGSLTVFGQAGRTVWIQGQDGLRLKGQFHAAKSAGPGVLLLHQCNREGARTGYERLAPMLSARGMHVLSLDFRGYGGSVESETALRPRRVGWEQFPNDVEAAYRTLSSERNVQKSNIGVVGASCGGDQAVQLAKKHPEIKALVFLSSWIQEDIQSVAGVPTFSISSDEDPYQNVLPSLRNAFARSTHRATRLLIYKGREHGTPLFDQDRQLEGIVADWLSGLLSPTG